MANDTRSAIALHQFSNFLIYQAADDLILAGRNIPKGWVNATQLCKANGKTWSNYWKTAKAKSFANKISTALLGGSPAVISIEGGNEKDVQGTWVHIDLAIHLAIMISDDCAMWAMKVLRHILNDEYLALTPEAEEAQRKLQEVWDKLRAGSKESFWFIADAIKQYYIDHPRIEKYEKQNYSEVFDALNVGLFGLKAKEIKEILGIKSGLNRDHFGTESLKRIDMIQRLAEAQVNSYGKNPLEAVKFALAMFNYPQIDFRK